MGAFFSFFSGSSNNKEANAEVEVEADADADAKAKEEVDVNAEADRQAIPIASHALLLMRDLYIRAMQIQHQRQYWQKNKNKIK